MKKIVLTMFAVLFSVTLSYAESCKDSPVKVEYRADEGNCNYQKRTCCADGTWSEWDTECEKHEGCFNGTTWEKEPDSNYVYTEEQLPKELEVKSYPKSSYSIYFDPSKNRKWFLPVKYTRENCKCKEGKGWVCKRVYKNISYLEAGVGVDWYTAPGHDCTKKNDIEYFILYKENIINLPDDVTSKENKNLAKQVANALGLKNRYEFDHTHYNTTKEDWTYKLNSMAACEYLMDYNKWTARIKKGDVLNENFSVYINPRACDQNVFVNGTGGYLDAYVECTLRTIAKEEFNEE